MSTPALSAIQFMLQLKATVQNTVDVGAGLTPSVPMGIAIQSPKLTSGNSTNQANRFWQNTGRILASGTSENLNVYSLSGIDIGGGSGNDALGIPYAMTKIIAILIQNDPTSVGNMLIGGQASANAWTSWIGSNSDTCGPFPPGACWMLFNPAGFTVGSASNNLLKIAASGGQVIYNPYILGSQ